MPPKPLAESNLLQPTRNKTHYARLKADLDDFRQVYRQALRVIESAHPALTELHLFPACPAPVAIYIGLDVLPKTDPTLLVYDNDKAKGGFKFILVLPGQRQPARMTARHQETY